MKRAASLVLVSLVLAGCGSDDGGGEKFADAASPEFPVGAALGADGNDNVLARDDFSDANSGWDEADGTDFSAAYTEGRFQITVKQKDLFGVSSTLYEGPRNRPELKELGAITVEVTGIGKPAKGGGFGVVCRTRGDPTALDYYGATVDADGKWAIVRSQGDRQRVPLASGSGSVKFGSKPVRVRLECGGAAGEPARLRLYLDGRFRAEAVDRSSWPTGGVGFSVGSGDNAGVVAQLDDFVISQRQ